MGKKRNERKRKKALRKHRRALFVGYKQKENLGLIDGRILHPKVRALAKRAEDMSVDKLLKEIRSLQEEIGLTPSEQDFLARIIGPEKLLKLYKHLKKIEEKARKKFQKEHPWMGNPYV